MIKEKRNKFRRRDGRRNGNWRKEDDEWRESKVR